MLVTRTSVRKGATRTTGALGNGLRGGNIRIGVYSLAIASLSCTITDTFCYKGLILTDSACSKKLFPPVERFFRRLQAGKFQGHQINLVRSNS